MVPRPKLLGSPRKLYASVTTTPHPEHLAFGEPAESPLCFTERDGLEHLCAAWLLPKTVSFNLQVFGYPSTWRRVNARTRAGRAVLAARAGYEAAAARVASTDGRIARAAAVRAYYEARAAYVDAVRALPVTPPTVALDRWPAAV